MKKLKVSPQTAKYVKKIAAVAMTLTLAVPTTAFFSARTAKAKAEEAAPEAIATLTFDKGFADEKEKNGLTVVKSEEVLTFAEYKDANGDYYYDKETKAQICELTDTPFIEAGEYKYGVKGNQAATRYDETMGQVFVLDDTVKVEEFTKKENDSVTQIPVNTVIQYATVAECQTQMNNPFAGKDLSKGASISYWVKVPASADDAAKGVNSSLIVFSAKEDDNMKVRTTADGSEKKAEKEKDGQLSIQLSANNDFHYVEGDKTPVAYEGDGSVLAAPDTWAYVTVSMTDSKVVTYVNGAEVSSKDVAADGMMAAMSSSDTGVFLGGNYSDAAQKVNQYIPTVKGVSLDDVSFYTQAVSADDAKKLYDNAAESKKKPDDMADMSQYLIESFDFENGLVGSAGTSVNVSLESNKTNPEITADAQKGNVLMLSNGKASSTSSAMFEKNPFAGMDLNGVTIDYMVRETATKSGVPSSYSLSFIDTPKVKDHEKIYATYRGLESSTVLYTKTDMDAMFCEGYTTNTYTSLKNDYKFSLKKNDHTNDKTATDGTILDPLYDADAVEKEQLRKDTLQSMSSWHRVTVVINNGGIKMYLDGKPLSNNLANPDGTPAYYGARFLDGYYNSLYDGFAKYYMPSNNQGATPIMTFLTDPTTSMYLGYMYKIGQNAAFEKTYEAYYDDIEFYSVAMNDTQVEYLHADRPSIEPLPSTEPETPSEDVNAGQVQAPDASQGNVMGTTTNVDASGNMFAEAAGVKVEAAAGVLPEGVELMLGSLGTQTDAAAYDAMKNVMAGIQDYEIQDGFIIYTVSASDSTVTPNGTFKLTLAVPEGFDTSALIVVDENGKVYNAVVSEDGKTVTIETDHFGKYAVGVKNMSTDDESVVASKSAYSGKTGDTADVVVPVVVLAAAGAAFVAATKKKKAEEK